MKRSHSSISWCLIWLLSASRCFGSAAAVGGCGEQAAGSVDEGGACAAHANASAPQPPPAAQTADPCGHLTQDATGPAPRIAVGFTTGRRPAYFKRTYLSFRLRCLDCDSFISDSDWFAVDDGSTPDELAAMQRVAPHITWVNKTEAGHVGSINAMLAVAARYDYFVWLEDDWQFVRDADLITKAISVLRAVPDAAQVLLNRNYAITDAAGEREMYMADAQQSVCGAEFVLHKFCKLPDFHDIVACLGDALRLGQEHQFFWPHFSLHPSVWRMSHMTQLGPLEAGPGFEYQHGLKFSQRGFKTAFLPDVHSIHLGAIREGKREAYEQFVAEAFARHHISSLGQESAYDLLGTSR